MKLDDLLMSKVSRRKFSKFAVTLPLVAKLPTPQNKDYAGGLTDIQGIRVGHFTDSRRPTGCTVVLVEAGAVAGVDVRGSAPGTRETDLLKPHNTVQKVHGIVLSGGSAFGLDSAAGVMAFLEEKGIGYPTKHSRVPIVPAAVLYDLGIGEASIRPGHDSGYQACQNATQGPVQEGNVGAGAGATVGKLLGAERAMKGGVGSASLQVENLVVAALVAVNAAGDIIDPTNGQVVAGARSKDGKSLANMSDVLKTSPLTGLTGQGEHTTLGVVATNAKLGKAAMHKIAQMSHDGLARAINPVHLPVDGDTIFSLTTGTLEGTNLGQVGALAAEVISQAVVRSVLMARGIPDYPSHSDLK